MGKLAGILILVIVLAIGWYLVSPFFNVIEVDDEFPEIAEPMIKDSFETMDNKTRADFENQTEEANKEVYQRMEAMPLSPTILSQGDFQARAHSVEGRAILADLGEETILRFEDFETDNGPNLHIYLSSDLGDDDFIDLGEIRATKGNINYDLPEGIDTDKYRYVLVWCVPFKVLFSYAELETV